MLGAGLAGIVVARENVLQGNSVRVLDSATRAGGRIARATVAEMSIDVGTLYLDPFDSALADIVDRSGHSPERVPAQSLGWWLATDKAALPLPEMHVVGVPAAPLTAETVAIVGRRAAWRGMLDAILPGPRGANANTLGELVRARLGAGIADALVAPVVHALTGRGIDELSATDITGLRHLMLQQNSRTRAVTQLRLEHPDVHGLTALAEGPSTLVAALIAELDRYGVPIELGHDTETLDLVQVEPDNVIDAREQVRGSIVTLVLDGTAVTPGQRGAGVLAGVASATKVRRVLDLSALWPSLYSAAQSRTVLRVESDGDLSIERAVETVATWWATAIEPDALLGAYLMRDDSVNP